MGAGQELGSALLMAPMGMAYAFDPHIWGKWALAVVLITAIQLPIMLLYAWKKNNMNVAYAGVFVAVGLLSFVGGSTAAGIASV